MEPFSRGGFLLGVSAALAAGRTQARASVVDIINERPSDWATPLNELGANLYTPNDVFFVRSHMGAPPHIDADSWRLTIDGLVRNPQQLSMADLRRFPKVEVPAVLQCAGNGRYFFGDAYSAVSHPAGAQWKFGGVGNARWAGVRVRDLLTQAGVQPEARFATNSGLDNPLLPATPKYIRGIDIEKLMDEDTILAYEMNGGPLPYYHGHPVRLVVPGWSGNHFLKWLAHIKLEATLTTEFWTASAYRYPNTVGEPGAGVKPEDTHAVTALNVKSIISVPLQGARLRVKRPGVITGLAWSGDGAYASRVEVSTDSGRTWRDARLGPSAGKYSWRVFTFAWTPRVSGPTQILARASDNKGAVQPDRSPWNPSGYLWNSVQRVDVEVLGA